MLSSDSGLRSGSGSRPQIRIRIQASDPDPGLRYGSGSRPQIRILIQASDTDPDPGLRYGSGSRPYLRCFTSFKEKLTSTPDLVK